MWHLIFGLMWMAVLFKKKKTLKKKLAPPYTTTGEHVLWHTECSVCDVSFTAKYIRCSQAHKDAYWALCGAWAQACLCNCRWKSALCPPCSMVTIKSAIVCDSPVSQAEGAWHMASAQCTLDLRFRGESHQRELVGEKKSNGKKGKEGGSHRAETKWLL